MASQAAFTQVKTSIQSLLVYYWSLLDWHEEWPFPLRATGLWGVSRVAMGCKIVYCRESAISNSLIGFNKCTQAPTGSVNSIPRDWQNRTATEIDSVGIPASLNTFSRSSLISSMAPFLPINFELFELYPDCAVSISPTSRFLTPNNAGQIIERIDFPSSKFGGKLRPPITLRIMPGSQSASSIIDLFRFQNGLFFL